MLSDHRVHGTTLYTSETPVVLESVTFPTNFFQGVSNLRDWFSVSTWLVYKNLILDYYTTDIL